MTPATCGHAVMDAQWEARNAELLTRADEELAACRAEMTQSNLAGEALFATMLRSLLAEGLMGRWAELERIRLHEKEAHMRTCAECRAEVQHP